MIWIGGAFFLAPHSPSRYITKLLLRQIARAKTAEGEASETVVESVVETVVVVVPYTGEPTSLNNDEVAAILGREGMDEDMGRQDSTNSVVEEIIVNTVSASYLPELGEHFWINLCFLKLSKNVYS